MLWLPTIDRSYIQAIMALLVNFKNYLVIENFLLASFGNWKLEIGNLIFMF